ncbi:protein kinase (macronuclear) [Tetrahymena thermophila SB210]|uniref:Protein kinase n=1 Tax=Tetrahymena thermophila (strain SB210) TaxID=312017 RepID=W7X1M4_TETTS|nr:protein kinase [Tetrahymena thermophila SB210]EWS71517.1 protein kinase [Tetrahymena thermophila SB210]|eukprot:XP_012655945.1 protein kinase [Tetrahymena thermophila SB210]
MGSQSSCCTQTNIQQVYINEINLSDHNQMMIRESTMKFDNQDEISDNVTLITEKKTTKLIQQFNISVGPHIDEQAYEQKTSTKQFYTMQESLKEIEKLGPQYGYTKSDTTLSQGDYDMGSKYTTGGKYTYNDLSSNYSAAIQLNDPAYIRKGDLLDPNGSTCSALHQHTGHLYAVKTYKKDQYDGFIRDQITEQKWIDASQKCSNLCRCYCIYQQENGLDVVYEHISGESIQKIIQSFNTFQEKLITIFARQIFKGIDFLHSYGLVHGNLKASNILIDNDAIIKITDLNIFKKSIQVMDYLKSTSSAPETLLYNELTTKSDIWSAGIVILEMMAGNPWVLKTGDLMTRDQVIKALKENKKFQIPIKIKKDFQDFLNSILQIDPAKRLSAAELLKHKFLKDAEQEERSLQLQVSMKDKTIYSQTSQLSRKGGRANSKLYEISGNSTNNTQYHELKSFKSQKSDGATNKGKYMNSKFLPSPSSTSIRDLNPDEISKRLDPHSPMEKYQLLANKSLKTPTNLPKKLTNEPLARGATTGSKVSYIKMLSVDDNQSFVDDKSFSNSQIFNFIQPNPQAAIIIANSVLEDGEKGDEQIQDNLQFIELKMKQILEISDYPNSEMVSMPPSPNAHQDNRENNFSFIKIPTNQLNTQHNNVNMNAYNNSSSLNNNFNNNGNGSSGIQNNYNTNSFSMSQQYNSNLQNNLQIKTQSTIQNSLKLKVNDQPIEGDYYSVSAPSSQPIIKIN